MFSAGQQHPGSIYRRTTILRFHLHSAALPFSGDVTALPTLSFLVKVLRCPQRYTPLLVVTPDPLSITVCSTGQYCAGMDYLRPLKKTKILCWAYFSPQSCLICSRWERNRCNQHSQWFPYEQWLFECLNSNAFYSPSAILPSGANENDWFLDIY